MKVNIKIRQNLLVLALALAGLWAGRQVQASHEYGATISYECLNSCTTRVYGRVYIACAGAIAMSFTLHWSSPGCTPPPVLGAGGALVTNDLTPLCPSASSSCTVPGAAILGVEEYFFYKDYDVCAVPACQFELAWRSCCRHPSLTSFVNPGSLGIWAGTTINTGSSPCNNSPRFLYRPVHLLQAGQYHAASMACEDLDHDSLSYVLNPCRQDSVNTVPYAVGYSPTSPLGPSWNVTLNARTGLLEFFPQPGNVVKGTICVTVQEWRNGQLISSMDHDFQYDVVSGGTNVEPTLSGVQNLSNNAQLIGDEIYLCVPGSLCFDVVGADVDPGQSLSLTWSHSLAGATFSQVGNSSVTDTIPGTSASPPAGRLCWTAPANGHYTVSFKLEDDACPLLGVGHRSFVIHVGATGSATATASVGVCPTVNFSSTTCGPGPFTYVWSGAGGLSSTLANPSHNYPGPGSYAWQVIVGNGSSNDTIVDTVVIPSLPQPQNLFTGGYFLAPCSGIVYDTLMPSGSWSGYHWNTGSMGGSLVVSTQGTYSVTVSDVNGCPYVDSATVVGLAPDIEGYVSTSAGAPLIDQKVYLILYDTLLQALYALDSIQTDSMGYYYFCGVNDTIVFVKAAPDSADYPTEMPTYADSSLFWSGALQMFPLLQAPIRKDFSTESGSNPGGPGFIGGLIVQGANKVNAPGDPMPGVRVILRDANTGLVLGYRDTDVNGYFSFGGLPLGDYEIVPDLYPRSVTNVPLVTLDAQHPVMDSLDLRMHWTWLELVVPTGFTQSVTAQVHVSPNPFVGHTQLEVQVSKGSEVAWELRDLQGRILQAFGPELISSGSYEGALGEGLPAGCYLLHLRIDGRSQILAIVHHGGN